MADGTRAAMRAADDSTQRFLRLEDDVAAIQDRMESIEMLLQTISAQLARKDIPTEDRHADYGIGDDASQVGGIRDETAPRRQPFGPNRLIKIDLPRFHGENPVCWLLRVENFFDYYETSDAHKLTIASVYLDGPAISWYQATRQRGQLRTWAAFKSSLLERFGPSPFRDLRGELSKLHQTTTVQDFYNRFEHLANQMPEVPPSWLQSYFESGLRSDIHHEVRSRRPTSLEEALQLALLTEGRFKTATVQHPATFRRPPATQQPPLLPTPTRSATESRPAPPGIIRLTPNQMAERRSQGLCFNCDDRYSRGHVCKAKLFMIVMIHDEEEEDEAPTAEDSEQPPPLETCEITYHALTGCSTPRTLRLQGLIGHQPIQILVDSGSTHNFIQPKLCERLAIPIQPTKTFNVMVGNGDKLECTGRVPRLKVAVQKHSLTLDCFLLPLQGADLVLGIQWLETLGTCEINYRTMTMSFILDQQRITLLGAGSPCEHIAQPQLHQLWRLDEVAVCLQLQVQPTAEQPTNLGNIAEPWHSLLQQFAELFQPPIGLPPPRAIDHRIPLVPGVGPVITRPYRYPHYQKEEITTLVESLLAEGLIRSSGSSFSSPVLLVKKKDGTWRFCVDYRALNRVTIPDSFPMPTMEELLDELHGARIFSKIDLRSGYHQVRMAPEDVHKTAFRTHDGHYEFLVMPFGLTNAPSTFQSLMNEILRPHLRRFILVFFDDILVFSLSADDHMAHLQITLGLLRRHSLHLKLAKCQFATSEIAYLGHIVNHEGCSVDPSKIDVIRSWPPPTSVKQLRSFLGLTGYYRKFVRHYAELTQPLTRLLVRDMFAWSTEADRVFMLLKEAMQTLPILSFPDFDTPFVVETDASGVAIGAVLIQHARPLAFFSRQLSPLMQRQSTYARELYAITEAVAKWRQYLLGRQFVIRTDQRSIREMMQQVVQTPEQQRFLVKLLGFNYTIEYNPGSSNQVADALSRKSALELPSVQECLALTAAPTSSLLARIEAAQLADPACSPLLHAAASDQPLPLHFQVKQHLLMFKKKIWVPADIEVQQLLMSEVHNTPIGGHGGVKRTLGRLSAQFFWPNMRAAVAAFVRQCPQCQFSKTDNAKQAGLLQPLPIPTEIWNDIAMDFITGLPPVKGKSIVLVVVDRLSKYAHFIAIGPKPTAPSVAAIFVQEICRLHGMPRSIVSDRDPLFLSTFWQELFRLSGTQLNHTSAYHPQSDGQTEVTNRGLEMYLRCFCMDSPSLWLSYLPWAELSYNTAVHSATKMSPFFAVYGRHPPPLLHLLEEPATSPSIQELLGNRQQILTDLQQNIREAQQHMTAAANEHRRDVNFNIGDRVIVRLQPYRQTSMTTQRYSKLQRRYFGPFEVVKKIGEVAYKLDLPDTSRIHPVFHVSKLKPFHPTTTPPPSALPDGNADGIVVVRPAEILDSHWVLRHGVPTQQVLVKWEGLAASEASWVEVAVFRRDYPAYNLEDKVDLQRGCDDTGNLVYKRRNIQAT